MPEGTPRSRQRLASPWRVETEQRVRAVLRRNRRSLLGLVARGAYESETRAFVKSFLSDALGFDEATLDRPSETVGARADYALRVEGGLVALVDARRVATRLEPPRISPLDRDGAPPWLVVTNAVEWHVYHRGSTDGELVPERPVIEADLLAPVALRKKAAVLVNLTRESFEHGAIDLLLAAQRALSAESLSTAVTSPGVLRAIQRELRRQTGHAIETKTIADAVRAMLSTQRKP
jgi:predicted type IV restriction endonuclease